jgi:hypothetical protein
VQPVDEHRLQGEPAGRDRGVDQAVPGRAGGPERHAPVELVARHGTDREGGAGGDRDRHAGREQERVREQAQRSVHGADQAIAEDLRDHDAAARADACPEQS